MFGDFQKARSLAEAGLKRFPDESSLHLLVKFKVGRSRPDKPS